MCEKMRKTKRKKREEEEEKGKGKGKGKKSQKDKQKNKGKLLPQSQIDTTVNENTQSVMKLSLEELIGNDSEEDNQTDAQSQTTENQPFEFKQQVGFCSCLCGEYLELSKDNNNNNNNNIELIINRYKENKLDSASTVAPSQIISRKLPWAVVQMYKSVGQICQSWKSGKIPKAFKMIPQLTEWEEVLYLCKPQEWTPHIMYEAVKAFVSQGKAPICQRFFNIVLLPRVRDDIKEHKKLNFYLYQAIKKALFKPQAFFKGFFLPLCSVKCPFRRLQNFTLFYMGFALCPESMHGTRSSHYRWLTSQEIHSGHTLGTGNVQTARTGIQWPLPLSFKNFLSKKYALPLKVVEALIKHFVKFEENLQAMPVIWHQTLLAFVQNYKSCLNEKQKTELTRLLRKQFHKGISSQIKKELSQTGGKQSTSKSSSNMDIDI
ncbi:hypothetical protein RFI_05072 [Reticulomyxa filosa]|uniref:Bystin n=1 Tax=Reticulomyxa filosa TaxID=46433 RepID=X6P1C2_RETFI|nr:hypothetical protein RFI_05072 [Reticulomyxa filosa]|eukprot:ETO32046.1 hypothetical protein RFI_05072 [Reticulomyxa filosa]